MERWGVARLEAPPADRAWEQLKKRLPVGFSNTGYFDGGRDHGGGGGGRTATGLVFWCNS